MDKSAMEVYFSLGSNLGDRESNIRKALELMDGAFGVHYDALSTLLETEPWGFDSDDFFLNCAVRYILDLPCQEILSKCKMIEIMMGRSVHCPEFDSSGRRIYRSRIIDIDILFYGEHEIRTDSLVVPHPLMSQRDFVMVPLSEIVSNRIRKAFPDIFTKYSYFCRL